MPKPTAARTLLPEAHVTGTPQPDRKTGPNALVRMVALLACSIRTKLLVAFLGTVLLLAGLALSGLLALKGADTRTQTLIRDQERFSHYAEVYGYLLDLQILALTATIHPDRAEASTAGLLSDPGILLSDRVADLMTDLGQGVRRLGGRETTEGAWLWGLRADVRKLAPIAGQIRTLRRDGKLEQAEHVAIHDFAPAIGALQRNLYTRMKAVESDMAQDAKATTQAYAAAQQQVIGTTLAAIGLALLLGYVFSSSILWPLRRIGAALREIALGHFNTRLRVPNRDELGTLAQNVNTTSEKLETLYHEVETQRAELEQWNVALTDKVATQVEEIDRTNRLRRFLPAQVADMIVEAPDGGDVLRTRRAEITVLFADLRGFTAFANAATPDQVIAALNRFHGTCGPLVEASGGTLERFLGDGLMVLFGAPVAMEDAAQRAMDLARDMRREVHTAMAPFQTGTGSAGLGLGIGIATGAATLGQIGFEGRRDYSAIGPAPNLAARLCDQARDGQILISHATAWQVESEVTPAGPFDLKGIGENIPAFECPP